MTRSKRIFLIDVDNTIANYSKGLTDFVNRTLRTNIDYLDGRDESMKENLKLSKELYESLKLSYRIGGEKLHLETMPGVKEFIDAIKDRYKVLIWTARPVHEYPILKEYTTKWLDNNGIFYDDIIWNTGSGKYGEFIKWLTEIEERGEEVLDYELHMIDDDVNFCNQMSSQGLNGVYLVDWPYNKGETREGVIRINKLVDVCKHLPPPA